MKLNLFVIIILGALLVGCNTNTTTPSSGGAYSCSAITTPYPGGGTSSGNQLSVTLGGGYPNEITVTVKVCIPGTTNCQTIPNVLLDTGSNGLRLFTCALGGLNLPTQPTSGNQIAECVTYADTTSHWGGIFTADVTLGGDTAPNVPIQVIDPRFGSVPETCTNLEMDPSISGYNGIIGMGLLAQDCGTSCASIVDNQTYYSCSGTSCTGTSVPLLQQVTNPVYLMATDNNGIKLDLPSISASGAQSANGTVTLGINTASNNAPPVGVKVYTADANVELTTVFDGVTYADTSTTASFIDSGSNAYYFPGDPALPNCTIQGGAFFCPTSTTALSATIQGANGLPSPATSVNFSISNASVLLDPSSAFSNGVFSTLGGYMQGGFDWGLPFFLGRKVYVGIDGRLGGTNINHLGPYWAF